MFTKQLQLLTDKTCRINFKGLCGGFSVLRNGKIYHERVFEDGLQSKGKVNLIGSGLFEIQAPCGFSIECTPLEKYNFDRFTLPEKERDLSKPYKVIKNFDLEHTPARISTSKGIIEVSPKFDTFTEQEKIFLLLHECGHFYYETEYKCDFYAMYNFLKMGYNKSQAYQCLNRRLKKHPLNIDRVKKLFDALDKVKIK